MPGSTHPNSSLFPSKVQIPRLMLLGDPEITAYLFCNFAYLYWEGCVICSIYLLMDHPEVRQRSYPNVPFCQSACLYFVQGYGSGSGF